MTNGLITTTTSKTVPLQCIFLREGFAVLGFGHFDVDIALGTIHTGDIERVYTPVFQGDGQGTWRCGFNTLNHTLVFIRLDHGQEAGGLAGLAGDQSAV